MRLTCVPNISEGRDDAKILSICASRLLLDIDADSDHNRTVATYEGAPDELIAEMVSLALRANGVIDLSGHTGAHPRFGAVDVMPFVVNDLDPEPATAAAREVLRRLRQIGVEVQGYGFDGHDELPQLRRRLHASSLAAVTAVAARGPLVAFNVNFSGPLAVAKQVAREMRCSTVRALGFELPGRGTSQVSMNLLAPDVLGPLQAFSAATALLAQRGIETGRAEIVGLIAARFEEQCRQLPLDRELVTLEQLRESGFKALRRTG